MNYLEQFFNDIVNWMLNFDAFSFMISKKSIFAFLIFNCLGIFCVSDYLSYIYSSRIKKRNTTFDVVKKYNILQRILFVPHYKNISTKVNSRYFTLIYRFYHFYLLIIALSIVSTLLSIKIPVFNQVCFILLLTNVVIYFLSGVVYLAATKTSPYGGAEFRKKIFCRRKNWWSNIILPCTWLI